MKPCILFFIVVLLADAEIDDKPAGYPIVSPIPVLLPIAVPKHIPMIIPSVL